MKNYQQLGDNFQAPAPYDVASGDAALVGGIVAIASTAALSGEEIAWVRVGIFNPVKKPGSQAWVAWTTKIYWDNTAKVFTSTAGGNTLCGVASVAVGAGAGLTTGGVLLTGQIA
jgi:predicted RecA/RadA family phage recombinase